MIQDTEMVELMQLIGMPLYKELIDPVIELNSNKNERNVRTFYIKFMSERGVLDNAQGRLFRKWLILSAIPFKELSERSFNVNLLMFECTFGKKLFGG